MISKLLDEYLTQALGALLAIAVLVAAWQWREAVEARGLLAAEIASRATENAQRFDAALKDTKTVAAAGAQHAADQQEITHDFNQSKAARVVVDSGRRARVARLRDIDAELAAAGHRLKAAGDTAASGDPANRPITLDELLEEGRRLAVRSGELVVEGAELLGKREAEVAALKALVLADRALMARAAGLPPAGEPPP